MAAMWRLNFFSALFFFCQIFLKPDIYIGFRGVRVYWHCPFSCATENQAIVAILIF